MTVGNGSLVDEKPILSSTSGLGVIPLTVELLSSDDSDDACERKAFSHNSASKMVESRVGIHANKSCKRIVVSGSGGSNAVESSAAGSESKLLLLQMASMFVEAEASRHNSVDDEQDLKNGSLVPFNVPVAFLMNFCTAGKFFEISSNVGK